MKAEIRTITPEIAAKMLEHNQSNRKLRKGTVDLYVKEMLDGTWNLTGQGITFGTDGQLLDGQHRLTAIVKSGVSVPMLVVTGAEVVTSYDTGLKRSTLDQINIKNPSNNGYIYSTLGIAVIRKILELSKSNYISGHKEIVSTSDIEKFIEVQGSNLYVIEQLITRGKKTAGVRRASLIATLWLLWFSLELTDEDIIHINNVLLNGMADNPSDGPIIGLRNVLLSQKKFTDNELVLRTEFMVKQYTRGSTSTLNKQIAKAYDFIKVEL